MQPGNAGYGEESGRVSGQPALHALPEFFCLSFAEEMGCLIYDAVVSEEEILVDVLLLVPPILAFCWRIRELVWLSASIKSAMEGSVLAGMETV